MVQQMPLDAIPEDPLLAVVIITMSVCWVRDENQADLGWM